MTQATLVERHAAMRDRLFEAGLLIPSGVDGVYGRSAEFEQVRSQADSSLSLGFSIRMNELKLSASLKVVEIVQAAMLICGIAGYRNDTPYSLGRELRDAHSAALMVHNDRITEHNASLLCIAKEI